MAGSSVGSTIPGGGAATAGAVAATVASAWAALSSAALRRAAQRGVDHGFELVQLDRLGDEIECAFLDGGDGVADGTVSGQEEAGGPVRLAGGRLQYAHAVGLRHTQVSQHQVEIFVFQQLDRFAAVGGGGDIEPEPQIARHRFAGVVLVVDNQNSCTVFHVLLPV